VELEDRSVIERRELVFAAASDVRDGVARDAGGVLEWERAGVDGVMRRDRGDRVAFGRRAQDAGAVFHLR
jgi:hypothetical protein